MKVSFFIGIAGLVFAMSAGPVFGNKKEIWKSQNDYAIRLYEEGRYREALKIEIAALKTAEETFGTTHPNTTSNLNNIGEICRALKDTESAEKYFKEAVAIELSRTGKENHPAALRYISNLALLYESEKQYKDAEKYQLTAVRLSKEVFGGDSPEYAGTLSRLGRLYRKLGKLKEAKSVLKDALGIKSGSGNNKDGTIVFIYGNLGMIAEDSGDFDEAELYMRKAVSLARSIYGEDSQETARNINNLSALYFKFSKYKEARELGEEFIRMVKGRKGRDPLWVSTGISNLAAVYYAQKLYGNAEKKFLELIKDQETSYGADHPAVASTMRNLGILYFSWKKYRESMIMLERSFQIEPLPGPGSDKNYFEGKSTLGLVYEQLGLDDRAFKLYRNTLDMKANTMEKDSPRLVSALNDLGIYYFRTGIAVFDLPGLPGCAEMIVNLSIVKTAVSLIRESGRLLGKAVRIVEKFPEQTYPDSLITANYYMEYLILTGNTEAAGSFYEKIIERYRAIFGKYHLNLTNVLRQFGFFSRRRGDLDNALITFREVIEIFNQNGLGGDLKVVEALRDLGNVFILRREYDEALDTFKTKLLIMKSRFGPDSLEVANDVYELGNVCLLKGNMKMAGEHFLHVLQIWDMNHKGEDVDSVPLLQDISAKLLRSGLKKEWRKLNTRIREILRKAATRRELNR